MDGLNQKALVATNEVLVNHKVFGVDGGEVDLHTSNDDAVL
jgi:hypothetical protein